jgi:hypothetical protein
MKPSVRRLHETHQLILFVVGKSEPSHEFGNARIILISPTQSFDESRCASFAWPPSVILCKSAI